MRDVSSINGFKFASQPALLRGMSVRKSRGENITDTEEEERNVSVGDISTCMPTCLSACVPALKHS